MIPCEPCPCGGRRLVYRTFDPPGARFIFRYRRCADCGDCSKTIQLAGASDVQELIDAISHQWQELVTGDEVTANQQLPQPASPPKIEVSPVQSPEQAQ